MTVSVVAAVVQADGRGTDGGDNGVTSRVSASNLSYNQRLRPEVEARGTTVHTATAFLVHEREGVTNTHRHRKDIEIDTSSGGGLL